MNYLAHAYCSFRNPEWMVGNMISDFIKGRKQYEYSAAIQEGIRLHRLIDTFTDDHDATKGAKEIFRPHYRLYAGAFVDVVYDYFLANDTACFEHEAALMDFSQFTYQVLLEYHDVLPENYRHMYQRMKTQNWLYNYRQNWGIEKSFGGVVYRSKYLSESNTAFELFEQNISELQLCYNDFAPDLWKMLEVWRNETTAK
jgi:acyl carrier protein phosphodiesterase